MKTLWILIEALTNLAPDANESDVRRLLQVEFLKSPSSHEYTSFYESKNLVEVNSELIIKKIDFAVKNSSSKLLRLSMSGLAKYCITREDLGKQYPDLEIFDSPRSPAPSALGYWGITVNGRRVLFGFANASRDCMEEVLIRYDL